MMLTLLAALTLAQSQPAVRRSTPASDDLGMVVRQAGTVNVNCTSGCSSGMTILPDGGLIGSVNQGTSPWLIAGADGGAVAIQGTLSVSSNSWFPDGGAIGYLVMPDGGPQMVYVSNPGPWLVAGVDGGAVEVQGSISATNPSVGSTGAATPASATLIGGTDGTNLRAPYVITTTPDAGDPGIVVRVVGGVSGGSGGAVTQGTTPWLVMGIDAGAVPVTGDVNATQAGTWNITNVSGTVSLPTGASTSALQTSGNASLSSIDTKTPALGQTTMAGSSPVVIASNQSAVPISGSVTASGTVTSNQGTPAATANRWPVQLTDGTDLAQVSAGGAILTDGSATTQPVSGTVTANAGTGTFAVSAASLPLPTGAATSANQTTLNTQTTKINDGTDTALVTGAGALVVDGSGSTQPVSGTIAATQSGVWNITNVSGTVSLPTGASTSALQTTGNTSLSNIDTDLDVALSTRLADTTFTGRFPAASLLADNTANPTLTASASFGLMWDGVTWDRIMGNSTDGLTVNLGANNDVTVTSISAGTNYIGKTRLTDGTLDLSLLNSAPGSDTGQVSVPVRIISSLAGGAGGTSSSFAAAFPATGTAAGFFDGTNMQGARVFDTDTGAGSQYTFGANLRISASGGSLEAAAGAGTTSASVLRVVLPTDQTVIPINDNGGSITVDGTVAVSNTFLLDATFTGRFAAAGALSDNFANPTTTQMGAMNMLWDGATWDRAPGNATDGALVNLGANNDVTVTGTVTANAGTGNFTVVQSTAASLRTQTSAEGATGSAVPANAAQVGFRDGSGNLRAGFAIDQDTSGSTVYVQGSAIVGAQFGAPLAASVEASAMPGTNSGLGVRPILKTATSVLGTSVTCATSATAAPASALANRHSVCIYNNGSNTIFIGPTGVTTSNGFPIPPGGSFCDDVNTTQVYSCIVASGTENARVLEN